MTNLHFHEITREQIWYCLDPAGIPTQTNFTHAAIDCMTSIDKVDPMIQAILKADHLSEETRIGYSKRLALIASAARNKALHPSADHAPTKSAELDLQKLLRSWDPENNDCSYSCCIQAVESEGNKAS